MGESLRAPGLSASPFWGRPKAADPSHPRVLDKQLPAPVDFTAGVQLHELLRGVLGHRRVGELQHFEVLEPLEVR